MSNVLRQLSPHSGRLERWLGQDRIEILAKHMREGGGPNCRWYGSPIHLLDIPGSVKITGDGDFVGNFNRGYFESAADSLAAHLRRLWKEAGRPIYIPDAVFGVNSGGFSSISAALARASAGNKVNFLQWQKSGPTGVANVASTLWRLGASPAAGGAGSAAPGGRATDDTTTGAYPFTNPASGFLHLTGADFSASVINNALMLYDRIFDVAKTMNSTATEAVTGVPTRYQSTTATDQDYAGGNFLFISVGGTALPATAHNWTVCTYTDQAGAASTLPSVTGNASAIVDRFDMPASTWFCPLEAGDVGIKALTQMQCSALVATGLIDFVMGHQLGIISFPVASLMVPFDWLTNRDQTPRIFNDACLALFELPKPATTATSYTGSIYATSAA